MNTTLLTGRAGILASAALLGAVALTGCSSPAPVAPAPAATAGNSAGAASQPAEPAPAAPDASAGPADAQGEAMTGIGNPASQYCVDQGGVVDVVSDASGEAGVCVLPDGSRVDEWDLYRQANPQ